MVLLVEWGKVNIHFLVWFTFIASSLEGDGPFTERGNEGYSKGILAGEEYGADPKTETFFQLSQRKDRR